MIIGVPREVKTAEERVAITPVGVRELTDRGHTVLIEKGAGEGSSIRDDDYSGQGARIVPSDAELFGEADLILKVKEPQPEEVEQLHAGQTLFAYLHLAANPELTEDLRRRDVIAIGYETVQRPDGSLPLLAPMSEIAGRMAIQVGAYFLEAPQGGRGILLGGVSGVRPARVMVLGAGMAGSNATVIAAGMQADVVVMDVDVDKLRRIDTQNGGRIVTLSSNRLSLEEQIVAADLVVGTVLVPGAATPRLVTEDMVRAMKPGAVLVDVAIDQGGCFETSHETTHADPVYEMHGVLHYAVGNIPGSVPHTSTYALTNATLPYVVTLAEEGPRQALLTHPELTRGANIVSGNVCHPAVAESLGLPYVPPAEALEPV